MSDNLVDRLVWQNPITGEFQPWLAKSWKISADHLVYTFNLRSGVTFSDGTALDAQVVKDNLDQHAFGNKALGITPDTFFGFYSGTKVIDPLTVEVTLSQPDAGFLQVLSIYRTGIMAESYLKKNATGQGELSSLVGSGPFVVAGGNGVTSVTLKKRTGYNWGPAGQHSGEAYLDQVNYVVVPEESTLVGALSSGQADISRSIQPADEATVTSEGGTIYSYIVQGESHAIFISLAADAPTQDVNVRLALQAATDRQEIVETALSPSYHVATGILAANTTDYVDGSSYLSYAPSKAEQLLEKAGWTADADGVRAKDGKKLSFTLYVTPNYQISESVLEVVQSQWEKVGIAATLESPSQSQFNGEILTSPQTVLLEEQTSRADPDVLRTVWDSTLTNTAHATLPELNTLVRAQANDFNPAQRKTAVKAIQDYVLGNALEIPLIDYPAVFGLRPNVHGFSTEPTGRAWLFETWLS